MDLLLRERRHTPELMDDPLVSPERMADGLRFIEWVNRWLGGTRAFLSHVERFSARWERGRPITFLDVGTGAADLPRALAAWGRERGHDVRVIALDLSAPVLAYAHQACRGNDRVALLRGNALALPFADRSVDYVCSSMFFHHLSDDQIVAVLRCYDRVARRGILVNDLLRRVRAYLWIRLIAPFSGSDLVRHDGPVSVLRGFRVGEADALAQKAGLPWLRAQVHFGHRFVLGGERP